VHIYLNLIFAAPGDRSHIPKEHKPIFDVLTRVITSLRPNVAVSSEFGFINYFLIANTKKTFGGCRQETE
jgi:hypothetical protein